jgi:hypothetical protein
MWPPSEKTLRELRIEAQRRCFMSMKAVLPNHAIGQKLTHVAMESRAFREIIKHF